MLVLLVGLISTSLYWWTGRIRAPRFVLACGVQLAELSWRFHFGAVHQGQCSLVGNDLPQYEAGRHAQASFPAGVPVRPAALDVLESVRRAQIHQSLNVQLLAFGENE